MPRVSIITATYNRSDVLRCAVESVLAQTFQDWELVVVGDACNDDTEEVIAGYTDARIRFFNRDTNFGEQSAANNDGFRLTSGELIAYLNHDDLWFPDHLETLVAHLELTGADLVYSLPFEVDRHGVPYCSPTNAEFRYDPSHFVVASLWLMRRELIETLGGWRAATAIHAISPSQDLLTRAWQQGKDLRCYPHVTALFLAAGGRPGAYERRDNVQHVELLARILGDPGYREELLTACAVHSARQIAELRLQLSGRAARLNRVVDGALIKLGLRPDAVRNRLARRPRGWWVDYMRELGGADRLKRRK